MTFVMRPYQVDAVRNLRASIASGARAPLLCSPCGSGKCLGIDTPVLMADGTIKPVQDVAVGDRLASPTGGFRTVLSLGRGQEMLYRVSPIKGDAYVVNASHLLSLRKQPVSDALRLANGRRIAATDDVVAVEASTFATSNQTARSVLKGWRSGVEVFDVAPADLPIPSYILGIWLGDGSLCEPSLTKPDGPLVQEWIEYGKSLGVGYRRCDSGGTRCANWSLTNGRTGGMENAVSAALRSAGVFTDKHIPQAYKTATVSQRLDLIAGLLDSDGYTQLGGYDWISSSERLARDFAFICRSVGLACYVSECVKGIKSTGFSGTYWRCSISGDCERIPCRQKPCTVRRQQKRHLVHGITVEAIGVGDYFGFEIDGDRLFMLGDFTVTHNTSVAGEIISGAVAKGKRILFLAPRRELIFQTAAKLRSIGIPHGVIMAGERARMYEPVQVASIPTLYIKFKATGAVPEADVIIVDECHLALAETTVALLSQYPKTVLIGLSATPGRSDGKPLAAIFDDMVMGPPVKFLTESGYLVPMQYYGPSTPDRTKLGNVAGDFNGKKAGEAMDKPKLIGDVVENWARIARDRPTVVFAQNISHARHLCERFVALGVKAENVDSETDSDTRGDIFARIKSRETQVLTSVDVVTYGFDEPVLSCGVIARPTKSIVRHHQMIGRLARTHDGKLDSIIIDNAGNVDALGFFDEEYPWSLDGDEAPPDKDERQEGDAQPVRKVTCPKCKAIYTSSSKCPKCGSAAPSRPNEGVEVQHDELKKLDANKGRKENRELTTAEKERFYGELKYIAAERGYKPAWASNQYRERLTVWPNAHKDAPPVAPSLETKAWVQSRLIRYAKSQESRTHE